MIHSIGSVIPKPATARYEKVLYFAQNVDTFRQQSPVGDLVASTL